MINDKNLIRIGYWRQQEDSKENLPWPEEGRLPLDTKEKIAKYLMNGTEYAAWMRCSTCRICGNWDNGSTCMTDGEFVYPEGYAHYILDHNIAPDERLLAKILSKV